MATPAHLRRLNQRKIVRALLACGAASRADLAKATGISQVTAGKIVEKLIEEGVVEAADGTQIRRGIGEVHRVTDTTTRLGRPGQLVRLDARKPRFLTVQLGVVHTRIGYLPVGIGEGDPWAVQIKTAASAQAWADAVAVAVRKTADARHAGLSPDLEAVVVSVPGVVDEANGQVLLCPNLRWPETAKLKELLGALWGLPVVLVQEIRALALGHLAMQPEDKDFLLVDFGDGVGGAAVVGGKLYQSSIPLSGELGHTPVLGNQRTCGCGAVGCVETLVSRRGLLQSFVACDRGTKRQISAPIAKREDAKWDIMRSHIQTHGVERWLADGLDAAAVTIAGAINVLGVRRVVVTGSLTELPACVIDYLAKGVTRGAMWGRFGKVECIAAPRRRTAGLVWAGIDRVLVPEETGAVMLHLNNSVVS